MVRRKAASDFGFRFFGKRLYWWYGKAALDHLFGSAIFDNMILKEEKRGRRCSRGCWVILVSWRFKSELRRYADLLDKEADWIDDLRIVDFIRLRQFWFWRSDALGS